MAEHPGAQGRPVQLDGSTLLRPAPPHDGRMPTDAEFAERLRRENRAHLRLSTAGMRLLLCDLFLFAPDTDAGRVTRGDALTSLADCDAAMWWEVAPDGRGERPEWL